MLPVLRTLFVLGAVARLRSFCLSGVATLPRVGRTASLLRSLALRERPASAFLEVTPRVTDVLLLRLVAAVRVASARLLPRVPAVRTDVASDTREGRADVRVLRSTSGR